MTVRNRGNRYLKMTLTYLVLVLLVVFVLLPIVWIASTSIKPSNEIFTIPPRWVPDHPTLEHYSNVMQRSSIPRNFTNSAIVGLLTTLFSLVLGGAAGYGFARFRFRGNKPLSLFMLLSQMLPITVLMIPVYFMMIRVGLLDTIIGLALAHLILTMPLVVWMTRSFFLSIPKELEESAQIDGCSRLSAFVRVLLPLVVPGMAATGIYAFIMSWNEYVLASLLTQSSSSRTLPIGLTEFAVMSQVDWGSTMAASMLIALPVIIFFLWLQKYFVQGLTQGAVKG